MDGIITFQRLEDLAEFLKHFTGSTSTFKVYEVGENWILEFTGGN